MVGQSAFGYFWRSSKSDPPSGRNPKPPLPQQRICTQSNPPQTNTNTDTKENGAFPYLGKSAVSLSEQHYAQCAAFLYLTRQRPAYSAMSAAGLASRGAAGLAGAAVAPGLPIAGGGSSCRTSLVYAHSWATRSGLSLSLVP